MPWRLRPYYDDEIELIDSLIKEGELKFGRSHSRGHLVQDHVQNEMIKRGLRIKFHPRKNSRLPVAKKVECNGEKINGIKIKFDKKL